MRVGVAFEELSDTVALPNTDAEDDDADDRDGGDEGGVFDKAGADVVRENDDREATEEDDKHELADRDGGEAGDVTDDVVGEAGEEEDEEEGEGGAFGVNDEVEALDGGFFENLFEKGAAEAAGDFEDDETADKGADRGPENAPDTENEAADTADDLSRDWGDDGLDDLEDNIEERREDTPRFDGGDKLVAVHEEARERAFGDDVPSEVDNNCDDDGAGEADFEPGFPGNAFFKEEVAGFFIIRGECLSSRLSLRARAGLTSHIRRRGFRGLH